MINGYKVGFMPNGNLLEMPLEECCAVLKDIGYDAIELSGEYLKNFGTAGELSAQLYKITRAGLELSEVVVQQDYITADTSSQKKAVEITKEYVSRLSDAGVRIFNLFTGPRPWIPGRITVGDQISMGQAWDILFAAFDELVPFAEKSGVSLAVENVWGMLCHDFYTTHYLISHYNSPALGVNFDPSHDQLSGNMDMEFIIRAWGAENIKHIHMKDAAGSQERGRVLFPPLGTGLVNWDGFVRGINAIGYKGVLSVEYEADQHLSRNLCGDWIKAAKESYTALNNILR